MRARTITTIVVLGALAIPASAGADPSAANYSRADAIAAGLEESSQSSSGSDYSSPNAIVGGPGHASQPIGVPTEVEPYTSPNAINGPLSDQPTLVSSPASTGDGFDWGDAALGAGAAMALVAFGGAAVLTVRRRTAISPSSAS
jgi:hypothetical protein